MEVKKQRVTSLKMYFGKFLLSAVLAFILAGVLWACLWSVTIYTGCVIPANAIENSVISWQKELDYNMVVSSDQIPKYTGYAIFSRDGKLLDSNMTGAQQKDAEAF